MRAAFIRHTGGIDRIEIGELPVPRIGPTEVLVRLAASEVNHVDLFVRSGAYATPMPMPFVIGRDLVGTVAEVGKGVDRFAPGDQVWCNSLGHGGRQGAFAEYAAVAVERLYALPDPVDPADAAAVAHGAGTAYLGLVREARLRPGDTVFVGGGAGAVGSAAVQVAVAMGAGVVASASPRDADWCRACGASSVLDYHDDDLPGRIRAVAPDGVDVWWDMSGHHDLPATVPLMRPGGRILITAGLDAAATLPVGALYTRDLSLRGFAISNASVSDLAAASVTINRLLATGRLRARIGARFPLTEAAAAQQAVEDRRVRGRVLVLP